MAQQTRPVLAPDWEQVGTGGSDIAAGANTQRWLVGKDGRAYRSSDGVNWRQHGSRTDLSRIAAGERGAAAIARSGELYLTGVAENDGWQPTGIRAADVGIGGGRIWLADAQLNGGGRGVLTAAFDPAARSVEWQMLAGRIERIAVDPLGRPWGLDKDGRLYVHAEGNWREDAGAPAGADLGVGIDGSVYVIAHPLDAALGGGIVHRRDPANGRWSALAGRLAAIAVDPAGRPLGVNSLSWVLAAAAAYRPAAPAPALADGTKKPGAAAATTTADTASGLRLADIAGDSLLLPATLAAAPVRVVKGSPQKGLFIGETTLNGLKATVARYTPQSATTPNLLLWHSRLGVGDYLPDLSATQARDMRLHDAVFAFVPDANAGLAPAAGDGKVIASLLRREELRSGGLDAGTTLLGTLDLKDYNANEMAGLLGLGTTRISVRASRIDSALFAEVAPGERIASPGAPLQTLEELKVKYGEGLPRSLVFTAPAKDLDRKALGPAQIESPVWRFALAQNEGGVGFEIAFNADLKLAVRVPVMPAAQTSPALAAPAGSTDETLALKGVHLVLDPAKRNLIFTASVTREAATSLVSYAGLELEPATLTGSLTLAPGAGTAVRLDTLTAVATTRGTMPSRRAGAGRRGTDVRVELALSEDKRTLLPSLIADSGLTLRDIVGDIATVPDVALRHIELSPEHLAGTVNLYGLPVKAVRYQTAGMPEAIVGLYHEKLDLASYVPKIREFSLGSFGLGNAVLFILPDGSTQNLSFDKAQLPAPLRALLDREKVRDEDIYPLSIKAGINLIGQWEKGDKNLGPALPGALSGLSAKVMSAYGIEGEGYVVKANFKASALSRTSIGNNVAGAGRTTTGTASDASCGVVAIADAADRSGLDLRFELPGFAPPYAGTNLSFTRSRFSLRDVDGKLESEIITGLMLKLPATLRARAPGTTTSVSISNDSGVRDIAMAGKLRLRGEPSQLCTKLTRDSNLQVEIAASSVFNAAQVSALAFSALQRVTEGVPLAAPATKPRGMGWERPFGIPALKIDQIALSGNFVQKDGVRGLDAALWTESQLGSEPLDILGKLSLETAAGADNFELKDWLLKIPGPVRLTGLPGIDRLDRAAPVANLGDLSVSDLELTPTQSAGKLTSAAGGFSGNLVLLTPENGEPSLFAAVGGFAPNQLLKPPFHLPADIDRLTRGQYVFALRSGPSTTMQLEDLPPAVSTMYRDLIPAATSLPLVRGFGAATRLDPAGIPEQPAYAPLRDLIRTLKLSGPIPVLSGVEIRSGATASAGASGTRGYIEAWIPGFAPPGPVLPGLSFSNTRISLNNLDGKTLRLETDLRYQVPDAWVSAMGRALDLHGSAVSSTAPNGDSQLTLSANSNLAWSAPFVVPGLEFGKLGLDLVSRTVAGTTSNTLLIGADANYRGLDVRARIGQSSDGSGSAGGLVELVARKEGDLIDLGQLLNPMSLLPSSYSPIKLSDYLDLKARAILISSEAGSGRISLAAEDVSGRINGQSFAGQLAVVGAGGAAPSLFIRSAEPLRPARFLPVSAGPFDALTLPSGLLIMAAEGANTNLGTLHSRIYDKVFTALFGAREAANHVLTRAGLTAVGRVNLATDLPEALRGIASWLPGKGDLIVGGGIENGALAFYGDVEGLALNIPPPLDALVKSAGGKFTVFFKTAGAGSAGAEAGLSTSAVLHAPRLDTGATQEVPIEFRVFVQANPGTTPNFGIAGRATGRWMNPLGLDDFALTDAELVFGSNAAGATLGIHTEKAEFRGREFLLDLDTAWAGAAPTQLAVQFSKSGTMSGDLILTPVIQAELAASLFKLALRSGSLLAAEVRKRLPAGSLSAFDGMAQALGGGAGAALELVNRSPLAMIGIRNPQIYFGTPGSAPPRRNDMETPAFGLGLLLKGELILDVGNGVPTLVVAEGLAKVNLSDGFFVSGRVSPPSPFANNSFTLLAKQPLTSPNPHLSLQGSLALPGMTIPVINMGANMDGSFALTKTDRGANVNANVTVAGILSRQFGMNIDGGVMRIYSAPSGCDIPLKIDGRLSLSGRPDPGFLLSFIQPVIPDAIDCLSDIGKKVAEVAEQAAKGIVVGAEATIRLAGEAAERSAEALINVGQETAKVAEDAYKLAISNPVGSALAGGLSQALSTISSALSGNTEYCNDRVRALRRHGTESMNLVEWTRRAELIKLVWMAGKQSGAIAPLLADVETKANSTRDSFQYLSTAWNKFAYLADPGAVVKPAWEYHQAGQGWQTNRGIAQQDTWYLPKYAMAMQNQNDNVSNRNKEGKSTGDYMLGMRQWLDSHKPADWDGNRDTLQFRCERHWAVTEVMKASASLTNARDAINIINADHLPNNTLMDGLQTMEQTAASYNTANTSALNYLGQVKPALVRRNMQFIGDFTGKLGGVVDRIRLRHASNASHSAQIEPQLVAIEGGVAELLTLGRAMAEFGGTDTQNSRIRTVLDDTVTRLGNVFRLESAATLDALNRDWSSTTQQPVISLPFAKKCLRSFYRPLDNANPLHVTDCHPKLQAVLDQIKQGVPFSPDAGSNVLTQIWKNATTGEITKEENPSYQFWLWSDSKDPGTVRVATAVSEGSPVAAYCLGIPQSFTTPSTLVRALPCTENDTGQLWTKIADPGGPAYFRLQSKLSGLCATWNGLNGVDALSLKECSEADRAQQVMTAAWPTRTAAKPPRLRPPTVQAFVFKGFQSSRCLSTQKRPESELDVLAIDGAQRPCTEVKTMAATQSHLRLVPESAGAGRWRIRFGNEANACLVATDRLIDFQNKPAVIPGAGTSRTIGKGSCDTPQGLWTFEISGWDSWPYYGIREAEGSRQCMMVYEQQYSANPYALPVKLTDCARRPLSEKAKHILVLPESLLFNLIEVP